MKYAPAISLGLSLLLGLLAFLFWRGDLGQSSRSAMNDEAAANMAMPAVPATVTVLIARGEIEAGTPVEPGLVRAVDWPADLVPDGALASPAALSGLDGQPLMAQADFFPGEPVLAAKLAETPPRRMLSADIPPGMRAVSIGVTLETGVAGFVLPGDRVDLIAYEPNPGGTGPDAFRARPLLPNVRVLAVDQVFGNEGEGALPSSVVTLALTSQQAETVTAAARDSRLGLALIGQEEVEGLASRIVTASAPPPATPRMVRTSNASARATRTARPAPRPSRPGEVEIKVVHGLSVATVEAPVDAGEDELAGAGS